MNLPESPLVVTRPAPDHRRLMTRIVEAGYFAIHAPAFEIEPEPEPRLSERIGRLEAFDMVIVTSPVAARLVVDGAIVPRMRGIRFFAPGRGTASALNGAGLRCSFPEHGGTSEHVLAMPELSSVDAARIAVVGAPGGRGMIAGELSRRGASVEMVHLYRRKPLPPPPALIEALRRDLGPVILISSRQAFDMITASLPDDTRSVWLGSRFVVSSGRLERLCRNAGVSRSWRATGASDEQMLTAVREAGWIA